MAMLTVFCLSLVFASGMLCAKLTAGKEHVEKFISSLSLGAMVGVAFLDLIPEIIEESGGGGIVWVLLSVAAGIAVLKVLDHFVPEHEGREESEEGNMTHIGIMSAIAIMLHNIVEGMTVYSVASQSVKSGFTLAFGVALHNIPMGAFIYSCLKNEKKTKRNAILVASALSTVLGGVLMMLLSSVLSPSFFSVLMSLALGMVLYIIFWELLPQAIKAKERKTVVFAFLLGLVLVLVSTLLE
ncbi:MAG: ZIP family metal transporter [Candidatus Ornithospirochaeta sp.]